MVSADPVPIRQASTKLRQHLGLSWLRPRSDRHHQFNEAPLQFDAAALCAAIASDGGRRAIGLAARQHGPDDPGSLVGHGNGNEPGRLALEQAAEVLDL